MRFELPGFAEDRAERRARLPEWMAAAAAGDVNAQLALAWEYARGDVIDLDIATAWNCFERAASSGQEEALVNRARFLQLRRVPAGLSELRALAIGGNWKAQFWLARHYQSRDGRLNQLRAVVWFDRSLKSGNLAAKLAKLAQLKKIAPLKSKFLFMAMGVPAAVALIWRMTRNEQDLRLYEPLMFRLKRRDNQSA
jgi:TPR repeat protein